MYQSPACRKGERGAQDCDRWVGMIAMLVWMGRSERNSQPRSVRPVSQKLRASTLAVGWLRRPAEGKISPCWIKRRRLQKRGCDSLAWDETLSGYFPAEKVPGKLQMPRWVRQSKNPRGKLGCPMLLSE